MFKLFDKDIYEKVNKKNKRLLKEFRGEYQLNGKAKGTIDQYTFDIKGFFCYCYSEFDNKFILDLKKKKFKDFFLDMQEAGCSPARINRVQCALRNLIEYAINDEDYEDDYEINYMAKIKGMQKREVREIVFLSDDEIIKLEDELIKRKEYQIALFLDLAYSSVGRKNELLQVNKANFLDTKKTNKVVGKRSKIFSLKYHERTKEIAKLYFDERGNDNCEALFVVIDRKNKTVKRVEYSTLYYWIIKCRHVLEDITGLYKPFNVHSFRHSGLENYKNGTHYGLKELGVEKLSMNELKTLAHHESVSTTEGYVIDTNEQELDEKWGN